MRVTDQIHIGSCTKAMTATLIGMLVDEGKLTWGSTIGEVFPDQAEQVHPDFQAVTLSHLLTHRAGLPPRRPLVAAPGPRRRPNSASRSSTAWLEEPPRHRPGSTYEYSNVGYALAGLMAERVADRVLGRPDEGTALRPARDGLGGIRLAGPARDASTNRGAITRAGERSEPTQQDNAPVAGARGHRALLDPGLGPLRRAPHGRRAREAPPAQGGHVPRPAHAPGRLRLRRTAGSSASDLGRRPGASPTAAATRRGTRRSGSPRPSTSSSSPRPTRATRWPRRPTTRRSSPSSGRVNPFPDLSRAAGETRMAHSGLRSGLTLRLSRSLFPQAGSPLTGLTRATMPPEKPTR